MTRCLVKIGSDASSRPVIWDRESPTTAEAAATNDAPLAEPPSSPNGPISVTAVRMPNGRWRLVVDPPTPNSTLTMRAASPGLPAHRSIVKGTTPPNTTLSASLGVTHGPAGSPVVVRVVSQPSVSQPPTQPGPGSFGPPASQPLPNVMRPSFGEVS